MGQRRGASPSETAARSGRTQKVEEAQTEVDCPWVTPPTSGRKRISELGRVKELDRGSGDNCRTKWASEWKRGQLEGESRAEKYSAKTTTVDVPLFLAPPWPPLLLKRLQTDSELPMTAFFFVFRIPPLSLSITLARSVVLAAADELMCRSIDVLCFQTCLCACAYVCCLSMYTLQLVFFFLSECLYRTFFFPKDRDNFL